MNLEEFKIDISKRSKKGMSFIVASIVIWCAVLIVSLLPIGDALTRNLFTFCCTAPLMPIAFFVSKMIKAEFSIKNNPLNNLGLLFSLNQLMYILIAMWVYQAVPEKMVMILAIIFGAHLLPFSWLYKSNAYKVMSIVISLTIFVVGIIYSASIVAACMVVFEIIFLTWLIIENKQLNKAK
jgi:hypothetical protein